ncbi:MAG: hypothetical protein ABSG94_01465 [Brevinematales bacterium]
MRFSPELAVFAAAAIFACILKSYSQAGYFIAPGDWAILKDKVGIYEKSDNIWIPGYRDAAAALNGSFKFISGIPGTSPDKNYIMVNRKLFRVQFAGLLKDGRKMIFCNFFDRRMNAGQWKTEQVITEDTDFSSWSLLFDMATGACSDFTINGRRGIR